MEFIRHLLVWLYSPTATVFEFDVDIGTYVYRPEIEFKKINRLICSSVRIKSKVYIYGECSGDEHKMILWYIKMTEGIKCDRLKHSYSWKIKYFLLNNIFISWTKRKKKRNALADVI